MSIQVLNEVLDSSRAKGTHRLLLVVLAEQAHEDGLTWPGIPRLARRMNTSERNIKYLLQDLEQTGELIVERGAGRGHTNQYRVLAPATIERLLTELTEALEKVKSSAEKVKLSALLEKVKSSAEKVKSSAEKVKSSAEKVKPTSPEPFITNYNHNEPTAAGEFEVSKPARPTTAAAVHESGNLKLGEGPTTSGEGHAGAADAAGQPPLPAQERLPAPQQALTNTATSLEKVPGGAARAALVGAIAPIKLQNLLDEYPAREAWLALSPPRIRELAGVAPDGQWPHLPGRVDRPAG